MPVFVSDDTITSVVGHEKNFRVVTLTIEHQVCAVAIGVNQPKSPGRVLFTQNEVKERALLTRRGKKEEKGLKLKLDQKKLFAVYWVSLWQY